MLMTCWCGQEFLLSTDIFLENVTPDSVFLAFVLKVCCFGEFLSCFLFFPAFLTKQIFEFLPHGVAGENVNERCSCNTSDRRS